METTPHRARILVMDDEEEIRFVSGLTLRRAGFDVALACDGTEAVRLYQEAAASGRPFAAVILDLNVPGAMGGREAMDALRRVDPRVRAFVSTGCPEDPAVLDCRAFGFSGVIEKPHFYLRKSLAEELERLIAAG
jgi:CheY-like chemotaxis protein